MEQLLLRNENENNEMVANIFLGMFGFVLVIWILTVIGLFSVSFHIISLFARTMGSLLIIPAFLIRFMKLRGPAIKYILIADISLLVGISYLFFTYQMVIMFLAPVLVALLYMNKKVIWFAEITSMISLIVFHLISSVYVAQPWLELFTETLDIVRFNLLPRMLQLMACFSVIFLLLNRIIDYYNQYDRIIRERSITPEKKEVPVEFKELTEALNLLSESEKSVFLELLRGRTNSQIADKLSYSLGTVKNYVSSIYDKLGCRERSYLILKYSMALRYYDQSHMNL